MTSRYNNSKSIGFDERMISRIQVDNGKGETVLITTDFSEYPIFDEKYPSAEKLKTNK